MSDVQSILDNVRNQYGIRFSETMTGGGCMALEARLESGHWIVATDEGLCGFRERLEYESMHDRPMGWMVGIYPDAGEYGWFGVESVIDVIDYDRYGDALPEMVGEALARLVEGL